MTLIKIIFLSLYALTAFAEDAPPLFTCQPAPDGVVLPNDFELPAAEPGMESAPNDVANFRASVAPICDPGFVPYPIAQDLDKGPLPLLSSTVAPVENTQSTVNAAKVKTKARKAPKTQVRTAAPMANALTAAANAAVRYFYAGVFEQGVNTRGVFAYVSQHAPNVGPNAHSLGEIATSTGDRGQVVEFGWTHDPSLANDGFPHMFVYHWINGQRTCYDGCGYVQVSNFLFPGMQLPPNTIGAYAILNIGGNWWFNYDGFWVGYFPGTLWGNGFNVGTLTQMFGEVAAPGSTACAQMGDGILGTKANSAAMNTFQLFDGTNFFKGKVNGTTQTVNYYNFNLPTLTGFTYGGPGGC